MGTSPKPQSFGHEPEIPRPERSWRDAISDQKPAFGWALAAFLGGFSISVAPPDELVRLLLPVGVMAAYVWLSYPRGVATAAGWRSARVAQLADSAYFLGFLWTLWALIDSFVLKRSIGAEGAFRVFGYALVTTAAGMATRLYLLQFKYGAADQAAEAEFSVERNLQQLSAAMQDASAALGGFQKQADALTRDVEQFRKAVGAMNEAFVSTHRETTKAIQENITNVVEGIRTALKAPVEEYGRAVNAFTANVDQQSQLLTDTAHKCSGEVTQSFAEAGDSARKAIVSAAEHISADHLGVAERLQTQTERIVDALRRLAELIGSIEIPTGGLTKVAAAFSALERAVSALSHSISPEGEVQINLSSFGQQMKTQTDAVKISLDHLTSRLNHIEVPEKISVDVSKLTKSMEELQKSLEGLLQKTSDQRWEKSPQAASDAFLKLAACVNSFRLTVENIDGSLKNRSVGLQGPSGTPEGSPAGRRRGIRRFFPW